MDPVSKQTARRKNRDKVQAFRQRMRAQGLRPVQIWVPDTRSSTFAAEAHRQSLLIASSPTDADDQAFIDAITDPDALSESERA